jgi:hypothetical protein
MAGRRVKRRMDWPTFVPPPPSSFLWLFCEEGNKLLSSLLPSFLSSTPTQIVGKPSRQKVWQIPHFFLDFLPQNVPFVFIFLTRLRMLCALALANTRTLYCWEGISKLSDTNNGD